jgi:hypothetical protein
LARIIPTFYHPTTRIDIISPDTEIDKISIRANSIRSTNSIRSANYINSAKTIKSVKKSANTINSIKRKKIPKSVKFWFWLHGISEDYVNECSRKIIAISKKDGDDYIDIGFKLAFKLKIEHCRKLTLCEKICCFTIFNGDSDLYSQYLNSLLQIRICKELVRRKTFSKLDVDNI